MPTSNLYGFNLPNSDVIVEAFDRCGVRPTALTRDQIVSARRSLNLELVSFSNIGVNLWAVKPFTIQIVANQAVYVTGTGPTNISANTVSMLDIYYSLINGGGAGINIDRIMLPMSRTDYSQLPNKLTPGTPTQFWYEKLTPGSQQIALYQPPSVGYPTAAVSGFYLSRLQDAGVGGGQNPDVPYLGLDALCARLAARLAVKFAPEKLVVLKGEAMEAMDLFTETDREDAPIVMLPDGRTLGSWGRD